MLMPGAESRSGNRDTVTLVSCDSAAGCWCLQSLACHTLRPERVPHVLDACSQEVSSKFSTERSSLCPLRLIACPSQPSLRDIAPPAMKAAAAAWPCAARAALLLTRYRLPLELQHEIFARA
jgi:hypothetical protein